MKKLFAFVAALALSAALMAQSVPFSDNIFSVTFNGPVSSDANVVHPTNTDYDYHSSDGLHGEAVTVRIVDHDIPVNNTSSDFYADRAEMNGWVIDNAADANGIPRSSGLLNGRPYTYILLTKTIDGVEYWERERIIIVNAREVIFIDMRSAKSDSDRNYWIAFEDSLVIK